jgi:hypothetical protein
MLASNVDWKVTRDKQYATHEPLLREAPLVVGASKGFATTRPSHVGDDEPWSVDYSLYTLRVNIRIFTRRSLASNWSSVNDDLRAQVKARRVYRRAQAWRARARVMWTGLYSNLTLHHYDFINFYRCDANILSILPSVNVAIKMCRSDFTVCQRLSIKLIYISAGYFPSNKNVSLFINYVKLISYITWTR